MLTPGWQGENAIYLGENRFYGHGAGIAKSDKIIRALNRHR
ncbi:MAG: hypothetical protein PHV32_15450 [Eubacteriales bacterium]|nr:hypothetical protein [Eubacteriales bacterium]